MADTASLIVRVSSTGVDKTTSQLNGLTKAAGAAAAAVVSLETAKQVFSALVDSQRNFDKLNSGLITMTGSAENAAKAFSVLQQFAKETPYGLNQAVEGFTKLVALGLNPSKEALISYGNTAAAMGKDLNQMIEAVADASTFEFERLKEFGIKSSQQADTVSFTFRGVTTTVKKNSEEIQKYLLNIGNTDFAGAMETRSKTLDGQLSSLADSFDGLVLAVAQSGFGDAVGEQAAKAEDAISALTDAIASNEIAATLQDWATLFNESFKFISDALNDLAFDTEDKSADMSDSLGAIPDAIREWLPDIQQTFHEVIAWFQRIDDYAVALGRTLADVFDPSKTAALTFKNLTAEADAAYDASIKRAEAESQAITNRSKQRKKEIEEQRKQYNERKKQEIDLASLVNNKGENGGTGNTNDKDAKAAAKKAEQLRKQAQDYLDTLARQNNDEIKAIDAQEQQKLAKAKEFYSQGALSLKEYEQAKTAIVLEAGQKRQDELDKRQKEAQEKQQKGDDFMAQIMGQNATELELLDIQEQQKLAVADKYREQGLIKEEQYQAALNAINEQYATKRADATATAFGNMASNIGAALGEASGAYKAFAIVQATIATYTAAIEAYKSTAAIPVVGPFLAPVAAAAAVGAGMAQVSAIRSAREQGGQLSAGQASTIAERGKPEVIMPAGASRVRTAQQMKEIMGQNGSSSGGDNVTIVNNTTGRVDSAVTERDDEGRLRIIISETVASQLQDNNSPISKARRSTRGQPGY
ncbi:tail length tape measure protein [Raoultella phage RP180]|uniref:Tail tape measure protein n=1 Tax=Raoultella phage RP180 TaxID=2565500 RepID=A0A4D6E009_9CAUD|nr:tail length tape measure protein [Raoultella phage RP180]QBZ71279.1 tail tape measure protein [Raoultella phage RP180]